MLYHILIFSVYLSSSAGFPQDENSRPAKVTKMQQQPVAPTGAATTNAVRSTIDTIQATHQQVQQHKSPHLSSSQSQQRTPSASQVFQQGRKMQRPEEETKFDRKDDFDLKFPAEFPASFANLDVNYPFGGQEGFDFNEPVDYNNNQFNKNQFTQTQAPIVRKSIYVHIAPPEEEEPPKPKVIVPQLPPRKHYQIVFIKAPTAPPPTVPIIPQYPAQLDKTLIYVLHPKPEDIPPIRLPEPPPSEPTKPEVYFIRYKNNRELLEELPTEEFKSYGEKTNDGMLDATENKSTESGANTDANSYGDAHESPDTSVDGSDIHVTYTQNKGKNAH